MKPIELKPWSSIGWEEDDAAHRVIRKGLLSGFLAGELEGGPEVQALEREWCQTFECKHAVSVNSATSGLLIALKAVGIEPGDEIVCSPYSMSAGVACILWLGATPVFCDINDDYDLYLEDFPSKGPPAILTTSLFGRPSMVYSESIPVIDDHAQAPFSTRFSADHRIYIDSFNIHKPMNAGEGGICWTNGAGYDEALRLLRNHGELCSDTIPEIGLNLRMTEVTAAIAREQLRKGKKVVGGRRELILRLSAHLSQVPGLRVAPYDPSHTYYIFAIRVEAGRRDKVVQRLNELGVPVRGGYGVPLYELPAFAPYKRECPNCEKINREIIIFECYAWDINQQNIEQIADAYKEALR